MTNTRNYKSGDKAALLVLSRGSCYWPDCGVPNIVLVEGRPVVNLEIAHIRAANRGGSRYVEDMSDAERNAFPNIVLLCHGHHRIVDDKTELDRYSIETLEGWKSEREASGQAALAGLRNVTEDRLQEMITEAVVSRDNQVKDALAQFEQVNADAAGLLRGLVDELALYRRGSFLDEGTVLTLDHAANALSRSLDEGTVLTLDHAANTLSRTLNEGTVLTLDHAVNALSRTLNEGTILTLDRAANALGRTLNEDTISMLHDAAQELRRIQGNM